MTDGFFEFSTGADDEYRQYFLNAGNTHELVQEYNELEARYREQSSDDMQDRLRGKAEQIWIHLQGTRPYVMLKPMTVKQYQMRRRKAGRKLSIKVQQVGRNVEMMNAEQQETEFRDQILSEQCGPIGNLTAFNVKIKQRVEITTVEALLDAIGNSMNDQVRTWPDDMYRAIQSESTLEVGLGKCWHR